MIRTQRSHKSRCCVRSERRHGRKHLQGRPNRHRPALAHSSGEDNKTKTPTRLYEKSIRRRVDGVPR
jgi:hypothetical protein